MSLASYPSVTVTAIATSQERDDLRGITRVQWSSPHGELEDSSIDDVIRWIEHSGGIAYVRSRDGSRGPRIRVVGGYPQRYLSSNPDDEAADPLLALPRLDRPAPPNRPSRSRKAARVPGWRWSPGRQARPAM